MIAKLKPQKLSLYGYSIMAIGVIIIVGVLSFAPELNKLAVIIAVVGFALVFISRYYITGGVKEVSDDHITIVYGVRQEHRYTIYYQQMQKVLVEYGLGHATMKIIRKRPHAENGGEFMRFSLGAWNWDGWLTGPVRSLNNDWLFSVLNKLVEKTDVYVARGFLFWKKWRKWVPPTGVQSEKNFDKIE